MLSPCSESKHADNSLHRAMTIQLWQLSAKVFILNHKLKKIFDPIQILKFKKKKNLWQLFFHQHFNLWLLIFEWRSYQDTCYYLNDIINLNDRLRFLIVSQYLRGRFLYRNWFVFFPINKVIINGMNCKNCRCKHRY